MGIAVPGIVRRTDGLIRLAPNLEWHDVSFSSVVLAALGLDIPVVVANDANLGALAEHERGAGVGVDDLVYISGHVGVGAGIIVSGHPLEGVGGYAGEVGHLRFDPTGQPCHCGSVGCWETAVGGPAIAAAIGCSLDKVAQLPQQLRLVGSVPAELRRIGTDIGRGLASIVNAFNPQLVVLGGYFSTLYPLVREEIHDGLSTTALPAVVDSVTLAVPALGEDSVLLGAAEAALEPLLVDPVASIGAALLDVPARLAG
jgi:predicted NBD/HSP70 family sugar kinase